MPPAIEFRNFSFFYGKNRILNNISFCLQKGERLSILGPNGSGKTTLLKNILRLARGGRHQGEILVNGRPLVSCSQLELARMLAWVPQAGGPIPPFSVRDFVSLSRYPYGWQFLAKENRNCPAVDNALQIANISHLANRRLDKLSGGQRQRVYLAAALAQQSDILLLDEPCAFLDPAQSCEIQKLLFALHANRGMTILEITHDLSQPFAAGGKALLVADGRLAYFGPVQDLRQNNMLDVVFDHEFAYLANPHNGKTLVVS